MSSSSHNRTHRDRSGSRAQTKRRRVFAWMSTFFAVAVIALIFLVIS